MTTAKANVTILSLGLALMSCTKGYAPEDYLTPPQQYDQVFLVMRYMAKAPDNVTFEERFYEGYDKYYNEQAALHRLDAYYIDEDGVNYFLISRRAPSLVDKRVATGGKMKLDENGKITGYEEVFRTWKMPDSVLVKKSIMLFDLMVKGQSLEPYLTKNSWPEEYIEFPDDRTYFDAAARVWRGKPSD